MIKNFKDLLLHSRKQSPVCFFKNGNPLMVFKGELFFLDCEESTLISHDFTNKKDNILGTN